MLAIVEIPQTVKDQIIQQYLADCHMKLEAAAAKAAAEIGAEIAAKVAEAEQVEEPEAKAKQERASKARIKPAEGTKVRNGFYRDNIQINSLDDLPKGVSLVNGAYQVYWCPDGKRTHHACFGDLTDAVVSAFDLYSNLPGIKPINYRSIIDWLKMAANK